MSKELEALERILNYWVIFDEEKDDCKQIKDILPKSSKIVETALKKLERLEDTHFIILGGRESGKTYNLRAIAKLQAFEIIKEKRVDISDLIHSKNLIDYNDGRDRKWYLTQEEFVLLKEVLL